MKKLTTIYIYFEYEANIKSKLFFGISVKQSLSSKLIRLAKKHQIKYCHYFSITKGYLNNKEIQWYNPESVSSTHPQRLELTDTPQKISGFINLCNQLRKDHSVDMYILGMDISGKNDILEKK